MFFGKSGNLPVQDVFSATSAPLEDLSVGQDYSTIVHCEMSYESGYLETYVFSDEYIFYSNEFVNNHNAKFWCLENFCVVVKVRVTPEKAIVWCGMQKAMITGFNFFSKPAVNGEN